MKSVRIKIVCGVLAANVGLLLLSCALWFVYRCLPSAWTQCELVRLFDLYCPLCGGTRALFALLHLDLLQVLRCYPPLLFLIAFYVEVHLRAAIAYCKKDLAPLHLPKRVYLLPVFAILLWFVLRNVLLVSFNVDLTQDILCVIRPFFR